MRLAILVRPSTTIPHSSFVWESARPRAPGKFALIRYIGSIFSRSTIALPGMVTDKSRMTMELAKTPSPCSWHDGSEDARADVQTSGEASGDGKASSCGI